MENRVSVLEYSPKLRDSQKFARAAGVGLGKYKAAAWPRAKAIRVILIYIPVRSMNSGLFIHKQRYYYFGRVEV